MTSRYDLAALRIPAMALSTTALLLPLKMSLLKCEYGAQAAMQVYIVSNNYRKKLKDIVRDRYALKDFSVLKRNPFLEKKISHRFYNHT